jgi:hypothetical protein
MDLIGKPDIYNSFCFKPFVFFNVFGQEIFEKNSYKNVTEIEFIIQLYLKLKLDYPNIDVNKNVGIISPYS